MSYRGLLAKCKLEDFRVWLIAQGYYILAPKGDYEVLRWIGKPNRAMPIVFRTLGKTDHYTCNNAAAPFVRQWLKEQRNA